MNIFVDTTLFNRIFQSDTGNSESNSYRNRPHVRRYFWPNDALPDDYPVSVSGWAYDGTAFTLLSDNPAWVAYDNSRFLGYRLNDLHREAERRIAAGYDHVLDADSSEHRTTTENHRVRRGSHPHPDVRALNAVPDAERRRLGWRYEKIKACLNAVDLTDQAAVDALKAFSANDDAHWQGATWTPPAGLPVAWAMPADSLEWNPATTVHDIDAAAAAELEAAFGGNLCNALFGAITGNYGTLAPEAVSVQTLTGMISRRRRELRAMDPLPTDSRDPNLWGHDTRVTVTATKDGDAVEAERLPSGKYRVPVGSVVAVEAVDDHATVAKGDTVSGEATYTVTAEDGTTTAAHVVRWHTNRAPAVTFTAPTSAVGGVALSLLAVVTDPDEGDTHTVQWEEAAAGAQGGFFSAPAELETTWTPPALASAKTYLVSIVVTDQGGLQGQKVRVINVPASV